MRSITTTVVAGCLIALLLTTAMAAEAEQQPPLELVLAKVESLTITLTLQPDEGQERDESIKLRSVLLHVPGLRIEPHGQWPDGTPISANARITEDQARAIVQMLGERGFFNRAGAFHSERREQRQTTPPDGTRSYTENHRPPDHPHLQIRLVTHDEDWYTYDVDHIQWGPQVLAWLDAIHIQLDGEPAEMLGRMIAPLEPLREAEASAVYGDWSEAVNGLRARLITRTFPGERNGLQVDVEVENLRDEEVLVLGNMLGAKVFQGQEQLRTPFAVPYHVSRQAYVDWQRVDIGERKRVRADFAGPFGGAGLLWTRDEALLLGPGTYRMQGVWKYPHGPRAIDRPQLWTGEITLPPIHFTLTDQWQVIPPQEHLGVELE